MKYLLLVLFGLSVIETSAQLEIEFTGIPEIKGSMYVAVYNKGDVWLDEGKEYKAIIEKVTAKTMTIKVDGLPAGTYGISSFHDANNSGEMDTSFMGIPKEAYGFSNNARPSFRAANWEEAQFEYDGNSKKMSIEVK